VENATAHLTVRTADYGRLPLRPNSIPARLTNYRSFVETLGKYVSGFARAGLIDAIYAHGLCAWGVRRASEWGLPLVVNPHGLEEFKTPDRLKRLAYAPFRAWVRAGSRAADRVIATDAAMQDEVARLLKIDPHKVVVLPNGIDLAKVKAYSDPQLQADLIERWTHLGDGDAVIRGISVGRLEQNKGFEHLLRALAVAKTDLGSDWGWLLVGEGSWRPQLERLSGELGLGRNVFFAGHVREAELHNLYKLSNLFAHPTLFEGSSLVTLEAMAHGLPVIASSTGGIPDKVTDGVNGFLTSPGDAKSLAKHIAWLAAHPQERAEMGYRSSRAVTAFDWTRIALATNLMMAELIEERTTCRDREVQPRPH
jgi:glycosyltransferase involved in cell wall biosynthesis